MLRRAAARHGAPPDSAIQTVIGMPSLDHRRSGSPAARLLPTYVNESAHALATPAFPLTHALLLRHAFNPMALSAERCSLSNGRGAARRASHSASAASSQSAPLRIRAMRDGARGERMTC